LRETLERLRVEIEGLQASRKRLVLDADADRVGIERDLHDGVQQHLVALAVNLQLAAQLVDTDAAAAKELLDEMGGDVQRALRETAQLAHRVHPPLESGGLAAALRSAAAGAGVTATVEVAPDESYPREVAATVYWCWLETLEHAATGATVTVRDEEGALAFEVVADGDPTDVSLERLRDRVEALGGRLAIGSDEGGRTRVSGSLPRSG
jgi:signal transduction histidine kinase